MMQKIMTTRFGEIEIDEKRKIHFPEGLLGFPDSKEYVILEHKPGSPFMWLQSMTEPDLAFVMTNPFLIKSDYLQNLSPEEERLINENEDESVIVFALVTIPPNQAERATVNLLGPIVVESETMKARQIILANSGYSHCHPIKAQ
jgi:flagellar assembly factor FliW